MTDIATPILLWVHAIPSLRLFGFSVLLDPYSYIRRERTVEKADL
jgi:hypothetical protein